MSRQAFWDEVNLANCEKLAALHLGERAIAERSSRTALATVRPEHPPCWPHPDRDGAR
jgi:hypothetical protein